MRALDRGEDFVVTRDGLPMWPGRSLRSRSRTRRRGGLTWPRATSYSVPTSRSTRSSEKRSEHRTEHGRAASRLAGHLGADRVPAAQVPEVTDEVAVSAVTVGELHYGVTVIAYPVAQLHRRRRVQATLDWFDLLPFDVTAAEYYGALATLVAKAAVTRGLVAWTCRSPRPPPDMTWHC
jgi:predicted nucleic acid-binding protein